jgi:hypothetical protein
MPHSRAETMRVEERRARVAELALRGLRPSEIAANLGDDSAQGRVKVSQDLKAIRRQWAASSVRDFDALKGEQLARLRQLQSEAWAEWEKSKQPAETATVVRKARPPSAQRHQDEPVNEYEPVLGEAGEPCLFEEVTTRKVEGRVGDAALARVVLSLIVEEEELLGLKARPGEQSTSPPIVAFKILCRPRHPGEAVDGTAAPPRPQIGLKELSPAPPESPGAQRRGRTF